MAQSGNYAQRPQSTYVQHGVHSWVDYSKSWVSRRQFLLTDYQADIITNLVSVALTLTAPRVWILVRALTVWLNGKISSIKLPQTAIGNRRKRSRLPAYNVNSLQGVLEYNLSLTTNSHSELAAARDLFLCMLEDLRNGQISLISNNELSDHSRHISPGSLLIRMLHIITEAFIPAIISFLLVCLFIAQTTGAVLSGHIFGDSMAISTSPDCERLVVLPPYSKIKSYQDQCYRSSTDDSVCSLYTNRTIASSTIINGHCPFSNISCVGPRMTFDTGYLNAKVLGLNYLEEFYFQKSMSCSQLHLDEGVSRDIEAYHPKIEKQGPLHVNQTFWRSDNVPIPSQLQRCDGLKMVRGRFYGSSANDDMSSGSALVRVQFLCPRSIINEHLGKNSSGNYTTVSLEITESKCRYPEDHCFLRGSVFELEHTHCPDTDYPLTYLACAHESKICDSSGICKSAALPWYDEQDELLRDLQPDLETSMARTLISLALSEGSSYYKANSAWGFPSTRCDDEACYLCPEEWLDHMKENWEFTLAGAQIRLVDTLRGEGGLNGTYGRDSYENHSSEILYEYIPPRDSSEYDPVSLQPYEPETVLLPIEFRGLCKMGKFRSIGWRNVSVWGLFGILSLAALLSLASVQTEANRLWLTIATELIWNRMVTIGALFHRYAVQLHSSVCHRMLWLWNAMVRSLVEIKKRDHRPR